MHLRARFAASFVHLRRQCPPGDYVDEVDKVCCHEEAAPEKDSKKCHIPWVRILKLT